MRAVPSVLVVLLAVSACGSSEAQDAAKGGSSKTINIFALDSLTGQSKAFGLPAVQGTELKAQETNAAGGLKDDCGNTYQVKVSRNDFQVDAAEAITLARKAASDDKNLAIVGPTPSSGFIPLIPLAGQLKMPLMGSGASGPVKEWNPYSFRASPSISLTEPLFLTTLSEEVQPKRIAVLYEQGQEYQVEANRIINEMASELGYEVVASEAFEVGQQDFAPQITRVKSGNPDFIGVFAAAPEGTQIVNQILAQGIEATFFGGGGQIFLNPAVWEGTEGKILGAMTWTAVDFTSDKFDELKAAYEAEYSEPLSPFAVNGYDATGIVLDGVKKSCSATDREALIKALATMEYTGVNGTYTYNQKERGGENLTPSVSVVRVTGQSEYEVVKATNQ
jgi:branched-chain amino acid transport system substrate-binding protein